MIHILSVGILLALIAVFYRYTSRSKQAVFFLPALALKLLAGLAYGWLYVVYYGEAGDSLNYFHDATKLTALGRQDVGAYLKVIFWHEYAPIWDTKLMLWQEPRAFWFVKLVSILMWIGGENYWILSCYFSFFSFVGSWVLVESLSKIFPKTRYVAVIAFLFFPSVVFFGSGLTKESLAIALLGIGTARLLSPFVWHTVPVFLGCALGLLELKFYYLAFWAGSALVGILAYPIAQRFALPTWGQVSLFVSIWIGGIFVSSFIFDFDTLVLMTVLNHNTTYIHSHPKDLVHYSIHGGQGYISLDASWASLLYNAPLALEAGLFRPYIWEASDKLKLLMSLENLGILLLFMLAILSFLIRPKRTPAPKLATWQNLFICAVFFYVVGLLVIIALASPNMGALVRYKVVITGWIVYGLGCVLWQYAHKY